MKKLFHLVSQIILMFLVAISSCAPKKGCNDRLALNHDLEATKDDGSCMYSACTFYQSYNSIPINSVMKTVSKVEIYVNGEKIGNCTYAYGNDYPRNCHGEGTILYQFKDEKKIYWNTKTYFTDGSFLPWEGEAAPIPTNDCIKIRAQEQ